MLLRLHGLLKDKEEEPEKRQVRARRITRKTTEDEHA
jgi:hypothetical protein